jgi:hypothetical protein
MGLIREQLNSERERLKSIENYDYYHGHLSGMASAYGAVLYWLGEKQATEEHEAAMAKILSIYEAETSGAK